MKKIISESTIITFLFVFAFNQLALSYWVSFQFVSFDVLFLIGSCYAFVLCWAVRTHNLKALYTLATLGIFLSYINPVILKGWEGGLWDFSHLDNAFYVLLPTFISISAFTILNKMDIRLSNRAAIGIGFITPILLAGIYNAVFFISWWQIALLILAIITVFSMAINLIGMWIYRSLNTNLVRMTTHEIQ